VAGTDPRTPRTETAYDRMDHWLKCRFMSYHCVSTGGIRIALEIQTCLYPIWASNRSSSSWIVAIPLSRFFVCPAAVAMTEVVATGIFSSSDAIVSIAQNT
jgi:hypothetical protein